MIHETVRQSRISRRMSVTISLKTKLWGGQNEVTGKIRRNMKGEDPKENAEKTRRVWCSESQRRKGFQGGRDQL